MNRTVALAVPLMLVVFALAGGMGGALAGDGPQTCKSNRNCVSVETTLASASTTVTHEATSTVATTVTATETELAATSTETVPAATATVTWTSTTTAVVTETSTTVETSTTEMTSYTQTWAVYDGDSCLYSLDGWNAVYCP